MANPILTTAIINAANAGQASSSGVLADLKKKGAVNAKTAAAPDLSLKGADKVVRALADKGLLRSAGEGRYWIDQDAVAAANSRATYMALIVVAFLLSAGASLVAILSRLS
ncbi:hypothetical protein GCM10022281_13260 [Sphingomonas rosea]|uniref:Uncharacterized protein n=1 Tax=Sphingomonas rosea TaxID=335605 RepID=A0ABP7U1S9_9SPHN